MRLLNTLTCILAITVGFGKVATEDRASVLTELENVKDADDFIEGHLTVIIGFFDDRGSAEAKTFLNVAIAVRDYKFAITKTKAVYAKYGAEDGSIILFNKYDGGKAVFDGESSESAIQEFIAEKSMPLIIEYNLSQRVFEGSIMSRLLVMLVSKEAGQVEKYALPAKDLAKQFKNKVLFVSVDVDDNNNNMILEFFNVKKQDIPALRLLQFDEKSSGNIYLKYKPKSPELTLENIESFVKSFLGGKLKRYLLSQELPDDWDKTPIKTLVTSNFDKVAFNKDKSVFVEFYAAHEWKQIEPVYDELAEKYKDSDTVVIAKFDAFANELEHTQLQFVPSMKLYRKGDNSVIDYDGVRTVEAIARFIDKHENPKEEL